MHNQAISIALASNAWHTRNSLAVVCICFVYMCGGAGAGLARERGPSEREVGLDMMLASIAIAKGALTAIDVAHCWPCALNSASRGG